MKNSNLSKRFNLVFKCVGLSLLVFTSACQTLPESSKNLQITTQPEVSPTATIATIQPTEIPTTIPTIVPTATRTSLETTGFVSGEIVGNLGRDGFENIFYVTNTLEIPAGQTLTLAKEITLVFPPGAGLNIAGQLIAEGNAAFPIRFVGLSEVGWDGLNFQSTSQGSRCEGCIIEDVKANGVALNVEAAITFREGQIRDIAGGTAIAATVPFTLSHVVIDNVDMGLDLSGAGVTSHTFNHLTLTRCQQGLVTTNQTLTLENSIVTNCEAAVSTGADGITTVQYTLFNDNTEDFVTDPAGQLIQGAGLIFNADPEFFDFPNSHRLRATSPAVDAADPQADFSGELGYNGGRADMGAYGNTISAPQNPPLDQMGASLTATQIQQAGRPGQSLAYELTLKNTGAIENGYIVTFDRGQFPIRLDRSGYDGPLQFTLDPQEEVSFMVWVDLKERTPLIWPDMIRVRALNGLDTAAEIDLIVTLDPFQEAGGQVVIEAEHADLQVEYYASYWLMLDKLAGYVGDGYVTTFRDIDLEYGSDYATTSPELDFTIDFATPGSYTLWLRGYAPDEAGDSVYVAIDDQPALVLSGFTPQSWSWSNSDMQGGAVTFDIATSGQHTLRLWQREDGLHLDRVLLTTDSAFIPTGDGPPESGGP